MHQNTIIFILIYIISQNDVIGAENEFEHQPNFLCNLTMDKIAEELMLRSFNLNCDALRGFFDTESFPEIEKILDGTDDSYEIDENQEEYHYRMKRCSEIVRQRRLLNEYEKRKQKEITGSQKPRKLRVKTLKTTSAPGTTIIQLEEDITERSLNYDEPILDVLEDQGYETEPLRGDIAQSESYQRSNNFPQNEKPSRSKSHIREKHKKMLEDSKNQKTLSREADKDPDDVTIVSSQNDNSFSQPSSYKTTTSISHTDSPQLLPTNQKKTSKEIKQASNDIKPKRKGLVSSLLDQIRDVMKGGKLEQMKDPPSKDSDEKSANDGLPDENFYEYELVTPGNFGKTIADQLPNDQSTPQGTNTHHAHDLLSTDSKKELQSKIEELMQLRKELLEVLKSKDKAKKMSYWKKINESETTSEVSEINKNLFRNSNSIYNDKITVKDEITASKSKSSTNEASAEKNIILELPSSTSGSLISSMSSKSFPKLKFFTSGEELLPQKDTKKSFTKKLPSSADSTLEGGNEAQFLTGPPFSTSSIMESTSGHHYRTSLPSEIRPLMSGTIPSTAASLAGKSNKTFQQSSPSINHAENAQTQQITHIPMISSLLARIPSSKRGKDPHHEDSSNSLIKEEDFEDMVGNPRQSMSEKLKNISHQDHGLKTFTSYLVIEKHSTPPDVSQFQTTSVEPTQRQKFHEVTIRHQLLPKSQEIFTNPSVAPFKQLSKEIWAHQRNNLDDDVTLQPAHHLHHHLTHPHLDKTYASLSLPIGTIPQKSNLGDNAVPRSAPQHPGHSNLDRISSTPPSITSKTYPKGTTSAEKPHQESHPSSQRPLIISHYTSAVPNPIPSSHPPHLYGSVYPKKTTLPEKSHQESHSNYQAPPLQHHPQPQLDKTSTVQSSFSPQTTHSRGFTPAEKFQNVYPSSRPPVISHSTSPGLGSIPSQTPLISHHTSPGLDLTPPQDTSHFDTTYPKKSTPPEKSHHESHSSYHSPPLQHRPQSELNKIASVQPSFSSETTQPTGSTTAKKFQEGHPSFRPPLISNNASPGLGSIPSQTPLISHHTSPGLDLTPPQDTSHFDTTYLKKSTPPEKSHHESHSSYHSPPLQHHPQSELDKIASVQPSFSSETTQPTGSTPAEKFQNVYPSSRPPVISHSTSPGLGLIPSQTPLISHHTSPGLDLTPPQDTSHFDTTYPKKSTPPEKSHHESHSSYHSPPLQHHPQSELDKIASVQPSFSSETTQPTGSTTAKKFQEGHPSFRPPLISNNASPDLHPIPSLHPSHSLNTIQLKKTTPGISHQENYPTSQPPSISHYTSPGLDAILSTQPSHVLDTTHPKKSTLSEISHQESHTTQHSLPSDHQTSPLLNKIASRQHSFSSETIYPRGSLLAEKSYQENYPISSQQLHHPLLGLHKILTNKSNDGLGTFSKKIMIPQKPLLEGSTHYTTPHSAKTFAPQSTRSTSRIETKNRPIENDATNVLEKIKKLQKEKIEEIERLYQKHLEELRRSQAHFTHTTPALSDSSLQHTTIKQHSSGGFSSHPTHMAITTTKPNPEFRSHLENKLENKSSRLLDITKPYDTFYSTSKFLDLEPPPDEIVEKIPIPLPPMNPNDNWKYVTKLDKYYEKQALRSTTTTPRPIPTRPPLTTPSTKPPTTTTPRTRPTTPARNTTRIPNQQPSSTTATPTRNQMAPVNYTINSTINRNYNITINLVTPDEPPRQSDDDSAEDPATDISSYSPNSSYQTDESDSAPSSPLFNNPGSAQNKEEPAGDFDSPPHPSVPRQSPIQSSNTSYFIPMNPTESSSNISQLATNHGNISQNTDSTDLREDQAEKSFTYSNPSGFQSQTPSRFNFPESSTMTAYQQMIDNLKSITLKVQAQPYFEDVNYSATQPLTSTTSQRPPEQSHLTQSLCAVGNCTQGCNNIFIVPNKTAEIIGILQLLDGMNSKNQPSSNESSMLQNSRSASTNDNILFQPGTFSDIKSMLGSIQTSHMSASENTKLRLTINDLLTALKQRRNIEYLKFYEHRQDLMVGESHQSIQIITQINEYVELLELMLVYLARDPDKLLDEGKDSRISNFESPYPPDDPQRRLIEDQFYYVHPKILNEFIDVYKKYSKGETYYGKPMWQYSQEHEPPKRPRTGVLGKSFGNLFNFQELVPALTYNRAPMYRPGVQYNDY